MPFLFPKAIKHGVAVVTAVVANMENNKVEIGTAAEGVMAATMTVAMAIMATITVIIVTLTMITTGAVVPLLVMITTVITLGTVVNYIHVLHRFGK